MATSSLLAGIRASKKPYYVYVLSHPDGTPFYVGLGRGRRILKHEWQARKTTKNCHRLNIIRQILAAGCKVGKRIDSWHADLRSASEREIALIAEIGRRDLGTGPLVNQTSGGNFTWTTGPEGRAAASALTSAQFRNPQRRKKQSEATARYFSDPEARVIASESAKARSTPQLRAKIGKARRQFNIDNPLLAAANEQARVKSLRSPETRRKMAESARRSLTPERQLSMVRASQAPESRAKNSAAQKRRFADPVERQKAAGSEWKTQRRALQHKCDELMQELGIVPPSRKGSLSQWKAFEARLLELLKGLQ